MRNTNESARMPDIARKTRTNARAEPARRRKFKPPRRPISFRCVSVVAAARGALRQYRPQPFGHEANK
ncbi:hypothetical protein FU139_24570 [Burkholderia territorii]|nr:hypothetical protein FU139_24570 [Burkholderia territorii]